MILIINNNLSTKNKISDRKNVSTCQQNNCIWADDVFGKFKAFCVLYCRGTRKRFQTPKRNQFAIRYIFGLQILSKFNQKKEIIDGNDSILF